MELTSTKSELEQSNEKQNEKIDELSRIIDLQKEQLEAAIQRECDLKGLAILKIYLVVMYSINLFSFFLRTIKTKGSGN